VSEEKPPSLVQWQKGVSLWFFLLFVVFIIEVGHFKSNMTWDCHRLINVTVSRLAAEHVM